MTTAAIDLADVLARTELFAGMAPRHVRAVAKQMTVAQHHAGDVITTEGRSGVGFHLILEGMATVETGRGVHLKPGDYFGEVSLIDGLPRTATVRADTDLRTAVLAPWDFTPVLTEHPEMTLVLLRGLCARLRATGSVPPR